jgi:hypothetical protein
MVDYDSAGFDMLKLFFVAMLLLHNHHRGNTETDRYGFLFYARCRAACKQGLVALAPYIEILELAITCVIGHLPTIIHTIPLVPALITILKILKNMLCTTYRNETLYLDGIGLVPQ